jgi:hypothetical protein
MERAICLMAMKRTLESENAALDAIKKRSRAGAAAVPSQAAVRRQ